MKPALRARLRLVARGALAFLGLCALPWLALHALALRTPLPAQLQEDAAYASSTRVLDRNGALVRHVRAGDGSLGQPVRASDLPPHVIAALLAAEDARFRSHGGVDALAVVRALGQAIWNRRIVSGGSTLTQQLARTLVPRPRTLRGKLSEMALAVRIERSLSKDQILSEYLGRAPFGPEIRGIEAASRAYFDKSARDLSVAEAAALASIPRGPTVYDPRKHPDRLARRRDRVLSRMESAGTLSSEDASRARAQPLVLTRFRPTPLAPHFVHAVTAGPLSPGGEQAELVTTLDPELQREAETAVFAGIAGLSAQRVTAGAAIVVDNETGDVLAWVGSPDALDAARLGANDGVLALRQPGSSLKPFVYGLAIERLGFTAETLVPDVPLRLPGQDGEFSPRNYDGRFHGPVRVREALANSYNVPAVWTASLLGPAAVLSRLSAVGLSSLDLPAEHYGAAIALGDGEVRLVDLAYAYATLARGGLYLPPRAITRARRAGDAARVTPPFSQVPEPVRVMDAGAAALVTDVLSDDRARLAAFGEGSALSLPFPVAAKTGTSKGYRDNIAVGYTREVTVAVWVGNFDGSAMEGVSGITGAGPVFHDIMMAAMRRRSPRPLVDPSVAMEQADVCPLSGKRPGPHCPHRVGRFLAGTAPTESCAMHVEVRVDAASGLPAGPSCPPEARGAKRSGPSPRGARGAEPSSRDGTVMRRFEQYPPTYQAWAEGAGRPVVAARSPLRCPRGATPAGGVRIVYPLEGARFHIDPSLGEREQLPIRVEGAASEPVRVVVDGRPVGPVRGSVALWRLAPGPHRAWLEAEGRASEPVSFEVD